MIFPPVPETPYRRGLIERTAADYRGAGEGWCARNNHPCDAERLDTSLTAIRYLSAGDVMAFVVAYDEAPLEAVGPVRKVLYVVQGLRAGKPGIREVVLAGGSSDDEAEVERALTAARSGTPFAGGG